MCKQKVILNFKSNKIKKSYLASLAINIIESDKVQCLFAKYDNQLSAKLFKVEITDFNTSFIKNVVLTKTKTTNVITINYK